MKMEIGFAAPIAGVVQEVLAQRGQQVAAGEVLLVIEPGSDGPARTVAASRLSLSEVPDPLEPLFAPGADGELGAPDLARGRRGAARHRAARRWKPSATRSGACCSATT